MNRWMIGLLALWPGLALGQVGFFDHFEGNALLPHWNQPPASRWEYNVSNSMLNVTSLPWPSNPHTSVNSALLRAEFPAVEGDFRAVVRMGWDPGVLRGLNVSLGGDGGHLLAAFAYNEWSGPVIYARTGSTPNIPFPAPGPGMHDFVMVRSGAEIRFFLDGNLLTTLPDRTGEAAVAVGLFFTVAYPNPGFEPLRVDLIQIVPTPATPLLIAVSALGLSKRRRY